jgi:tetratricopeptide (TPR) repeat protein
MIGLCYSEKGMQTEGISQFKKALYVEEISEREQLSLYYELGVAYERLQDWRESLYYYEKVVKRDPKFRDIDRRMQEAKQALGGAAPTNGAAAAGAHRVDEVDSALENIFGGDAEG